MLLRSKLDRIITFLGIAGFIFAGLLSQQVFPSAAIDLSVPRQAIHQRAEVYLTDQLAGYDNDSLSSDTEISDAMTSNAATSGNTASSTKVSDEGDRTLNYSNIDLSEYESVQRFGQSSRV